MQEKDKMKSIDLTLTENELKFLVDLMWGAPLGIVKSTAERHKIDDTSIESHLVKCLGYCSLESDS